MNLKRLMTSVLFTVLMMTFSYAQEKTVSGTISDEFEMPLPGVSIIVQGTTRGTQTDFDGNYNISVSEGEVLEFSYVGYAKVQRTVGSSNTINFSMEPDTEALEEVVVVAYGTATKESFTGTATTIKAEDIQAKSTSNITQALAGEVAGVNVINTSGQPGTFSTVRIRGFGSVNGNRSPLYVVDGVPFSVENMNSINPGDIESQTVLKDATATAIYGARGANGVVLITTKKGKAGQSNIEIDVRSGFNFQLLPRNQVIESPEEYLELSWEALYNRGQATGEPNPAAFASVSLFSNVGMDPHYNMWNAPGNEIINPETGQVYDGMTRKYNPEDWEDYGFQTSYRQEANLRFSGGNDKTRYFSSFGFLEDQGYIINSDYRRYSTRLNVTHKPKEWISANANLGYTLSKSNQNGQSSDSGSIFWFVDNIPSIYPLFLRDDDGNIVEDPIFGGNQYDYGQGRDFGTLTNSIADAHYTKDQDNRHEINGNFSFDIDLHENLTFETKFGAQYFNNKYTLLNSPFYGSAASQDPPGSVYKQDWQEFTQNFLQMFRYNNTWGIHDLEVLAAHESNNWEQNVSAASKSGIVHPEIDDLNNFVITTPPSGYTNKVALESYFGQLNYNYDQKYYFSGSVRRDGSSRFVNNKWGTFGSVGASWIMSKENFLIDSDLFTFLKLKASYGLMGEQAGVGYYPGINTYNVGNLNGGISLPIGVNGSPDLTWETSKMFQTGVEFSLGDYLDGNIDYFIKDTDDLIFDRRVGPSQGIAIIKVNDGNLINRGLEFDFTAHLINKQDFSLDLSLNGAMLDNEIKTMPIEPSTGDPRIIDTANSPYGMAEGHSIYDYYMREWAGVDPADGTAMWYMYYDDANNDGTLNPGEETILSMEQYMAENPDANVERTVTKTYADATDKFIGKSAIPKVRGGFRLAARYKNFDFGAQFLYSLGGYAYDGAYARLMDNTTVGGNNWHVDIRDRWQQPGDVTDVPRLSDGFDTNVSSSSTRFLTKSDYLSLNNIRLGYTLKGDKLPKLGVEHIRLSLTGDNLWLLSAREGFNPTTSETGGTSMYTYSPLSTLTLGLNVKF